MRNLFIIFVFILLLTACKDSNYMPLPENDAQYFPLTTQTQWIDSITRIVIDAPSAYYDTTTYIEKTTVDSMQIKTQTEKIYCTKYKYNKTTDQWQVQYPYWFERTEKQLVRFENNKIWLDLVFPLPEGQTWNTYAYHVHSDTLLHNTVAKINEPGFINGSFYDSTLTIHHQMDSTLIYKYTEVSRYARGKGFLRSESTSIISDDPTFDYTLPIEERIKTATFITTKRSYSIQNEQ